MNNIEKLDKKYRTYLKISGTVLMGMGTFLLLVLSVSTLSDIGSKSSEKTIQVKGHAEIEATPDIRYVTINILGKGKTEKESKDDAAKKGQQAIGFVKSKDIADADISNQNLSTYPTYNNKSQYCPKYQSVSGGGVSGGMMVPNSIAVPPAGSGANDMIYCGNDSVITGYETSQTIQVKLRGDKMDMAGDLISLVTGDGVTAQTGEATIDNVTAIQNDVRDTAIADARKNAERLAGALGVRLGSVQSFNENAGGYYPMVMKAGMAVADSAVSNPSPIIPNGTQKVTSDVVVTYEIR